MTPRATRLELAGLAIVFAIGLGQRAASPSRMAVEHFDEGVYASNLYTDDGRFPFQHLYAPPLLPFCLEVAAIFGGPQAVMWVNVVSGSLTLLVLWGMVRQWWGPPAAIAAMTLLAFNEFHIAYSRAALTDAMLGLWMTAGVWAGWRAIRFGGAANLAAAGVLASLAWWTKYNGWLTLAITGAGTAGWILFGGARANTTASGGRQPPDDSLRKSTPKKRTKASGGSHPPLAGAPRTETAFGAAKVFLGRWTLTAAIAFLLWSPWLWALQKYGGYSAVAKNHAGYFTGLGQWWGNAIRQAAAIAHDSHQLTRWSLAFAFVLASVVAWSRGRTAIAVASTSDERVVRDDAKASALMVWMAAAWFIGLSVAVPLYQPYPRLSLPWLIGATLLLAGLAGRLFASNSSRPMLRYVAAIGAAMVWLFCLTSNGAGGREAWETRTGLETSASSILNKLGSEPLPRAMNGVRCALYVVAEPGLYFHLAAGQRDSAAGHLTLPAADFDAARVSASQSDLPLYIVAGPHAEASHPGVADRLIADGRLELVEEFEYLPSDLVLLDGRPAWDLPPKDKPVVEKIRLLHVKP